MITGRQRQCDLVKLPTGLRTRTDNFCISVANWALEGYQVMLCQRCFLPEKSEKVRLPDSNQRSFLARDCLDSQWNTSGIHDLHNGHLGTAPMPLLHLQPKVGNPSAQNMMC